MRPTQAWRPTSPLSLDDLVLQRARAQAVENGTSVNAVGRDFLERYSGGEAAEIAVRECVEAARASVGRQRG
jgi:hypothetical protein